jgi:phage gp36-like protein
MSAYLTTTHVANRLRRNYDTLYTRQGDSAVDTALVDADIEAAEAEIHSYLAQRYTVPVTDPEAVKLCRAWALILLEEAAYAAIPGRDLPKAITDRAAAVRERLTAVAEGKLSLGTAAEIADADTSPGADFISDGPDPVYSRDQMEGF